MTKRCEINYLLTLTLHSVTPAYTHKMYSLIKYSDSIFFRNAFTDYGLSVAAVCINKHCTLIVSVSDRSLIKRHTGKNMYIYK